VSVIELKQEMSTENYKTCILKSNNCLPGYLFWNDEPSRGDVFSVEHMWEREN